MPLHFLNLKSFHPANKANQQKLYQAEEDYKERRRREEDALKSFEREQQLFAHRIQLEKEQKMNMSQIDIMRKRKEKLAAQGIEENVNTVLDTPATTANNSKRKNRKRGKRSNGPATTNANSSLTAAIEAAGSLFEFRPEGDIFAAAKPLMQDDLKNITSVLPQDKKDDTEDAQLTEMAPELPNKAEVAAAHDAIAMLQEKAAELKQQMVEQNNEPDLLAFMHDDKQVAELLASVADDKELLDTLTPRERKLLLRKYKQIKKKLYSDSSVASHSEEPAPKRQRVH